MIISEEVLVDGRGDHSSVSGTLTAKVDGLDSNPLIRAVGQSVLDSFVLPGKTDPTVLARQVAEGMRAGVRSAIGSCVLVFQGFQVFEEDSNLLEQFRTALVGETLSHAGVPG